MIHCTSHCISIVTKSYCILSASMPFSGRFSVASISFRPWISWTAPKVSTSIKGAQGLTWTLKVHCHFSKLQNVKPWFFQIYNELYNSYTCGNTKRHRNFLETIAPSHPKDVQFGQVLLRWAYQTERMPVTTSSNPKRTSLGMFGF